MQLTHPRSEPVPEAVKLQARKFEDQGFTIDRIEYGQCSEPQANGLAGWRIDFRDERRSWHCWVFSSDPLAGEAAIAVDAEIC